MHQLVPPDVLASANRVLFITHLAIGDFAYWQNYFVAFSQQYPHIKIDVWVDEVRRTRCFWRWNTLKNYSLYDWLAECPFINKVYRETYSPGTFKKSLRVAKAERYPLVVSLTTLRPHRYVKLARQVSPQGFVVGLTNKTKFFQIKQKLAYKKLDVALSLREVTSSGDHITDTYAAIMERLFGVLVEQDARAPFILIPRKWVTFAKLRFLKWGIDKKSNEFGTVFFINAFAKGDKRCWPLDKVLALMTELKQNDHWRDISFVVNVPPEELSSVQKFFNKHSINDTYLFSAQHNFFQLPAVISICDAVISVETSVMHLASALKVPVVALMRTKNPEWRPWDAERSIVVYAPTRQSWVKDIDVRLVLDGVNQLAKRFFRTFMGVFSLQCFPWWQLLI